MNARTEERVEGWTTRSLSGGHEGLRDLTDEEFSGVVRAEGGAWLCMLNGKVVGVFDGSIDDFEDASGTAYVAPDPGLPLLFAMEQRGGTVEEEYYTQDTPISEAHDTLSSGSFTGYVELSENVLSGDYYVLYYGGRSMSLAFVGSSERLVTGDEAFDRADDEVGIYEVRSVDVDVVEIPAPEPEPDPEPTAAEESGPGAGSEGDDGGTAPASNAEATGVTAPSSETGGDAGRAPGNEDARTGGTSPDRERGHTATEAGGPDREPPGGSTETTGPAREAPADADRRRGASGATEGSRPAEGSATDSRGAGDSSPRGSTADGRADDARGGRDPLAGENGGAADRGGSGDRADRGGSGERPDERGGDRRFRDEAAWRKDPSVPSIADREPDEDKIAEIHEALDEQETAIERIADHLDSVEREAATDRDRLRGGLDDLSEDLADLRRSVMRLDQTVDRIEGDLDDRIRRIVEAEVGSLDSERTGSVGTTEPDPEPEPAEPATAEPEPDTEPTESDTADPAGGSRSPPAVGDGPDLSVDEALEETTLLVRYGSQGKPTLKSAHGGGASREEVNDNLRIDAHTPFDAASATVEGRPFRSFLEERMEYRFFEWVVRDLLYEFRETGNDTALKQLYDAIPRIDRAEMRGSVSVPPADDEEGEERVRFDVVARDARGSPLAVANLNDSRDPATQGMVVELNDRATRVREAGDLSGAFLVTASYFEGDARETAEDATSGSLLSRDSRKSFVKLSRKRGYHLCLVEANDGGFHVSVPEL